MNRRILTILTLAVVVAGVIAAVLFASRVPQAASEAPQVAQLKVGDSAPEFQAATTSGLFDLQNNGGKPTFLEVFATWCPHCQRETVIINHLYAKYGSRVNFVAVNGSPKGMDEMSPESQVDVYNFTQVFHVKYPVAYDPQLTVAKSYLQGGYPTIVIITKENKIADIVSGEQPESALTADLDAVLK